MHIIRGPRGVYVVDSIKTDYDDRNFITRLLYEDMYWLFFSRYFSSIWYIV